MPSYKLNYFPIRGRAEIVRLVFAQAGVEYEDNRIPSELWPQYKPETPWGQMPVLEVDGRPLGQSITIARFIARQHGLAGKDNFEQALADSIVDCLVELQNLIIRAWFEKDEATKAELLKKLQDEDVPRTLNNLERFLGSNDFFVGNQVTWADLFFQNIGEILLKRNVDAFSKHDKLNALYKRVESLQNIKKWLEMRPKTDI